LLIISAEPAASRVAFIVDALDSFSVNPRGISASGLAAGIYRRIFYLENSGLCRVDLFFLHHFSF